MTIHHAYVNYFAAYNYCAPGYLPRFSNVLDYISHSNTIGGEQDLIRDDKVFQVWHKEIFVDEISE